MRFAAQDTGHPCAREELEVLSDPDRLVAGERPNNWLGPCLARGILEAHGTRLEAESEADPGNLFYFTLPFAAGQWPVWLIR